VPEPAGGTTSIVPATVCSRRPGKLYATALYVRTDDLLKESPQLAPYRPGSGIGPELSDAELVTVAVMQALLGFTSEARWLRHARAHLRHLFPTFPSSPATTSGCAGRQG
jgi:hypothetical protein